MVEDDPSIAARLVNGLRGAGFEVELDTRGDSALAHGLDPEFDLIVLDLNLPGMHGFDLLARWHARSSTPVVVLTALTDLDARLRSFDLGAVDWMSKPFFLAELISRIRARLRLEARAGRRVIGHGPLALDLDRQMVQVNGEPVTLTTTEFTVLRYLVERAGRPLTRGQISDGALPPDGDRQARTVDVFVARLRRKLGPAGDLIQTVWGLGYRFDDGA